MAPSFGGGRDQCREVLVRGVDDGDALFFPLGDVEFVVDGCSDTGDGLKEEPDRTPSFDVGRWVVGMTGRRVYGRRGG